MTKNIFKSALLFCLAAVALTACNSSDDYFSSSAQNKAMTVTAVYLQDADATVTSRQVEFARLGSIIRLEGTGLYGLKYIYVNGYDTYFNRSYVSDVAAIFQLDTDTPITDADDDVRNTIQLVKDGASLTIDFEIRASSPTVSNVNITLPMAGETVIVSGNNLHETYLVELPDGTQITDIENDEDGAWYSFVYPSSASQVGGSIIGYGANGTSMSPAYFNEVGAVIIDFENADDLGSWSATYNNSDVDYVTDPLNSGRGNVVPIVPEAYLPINGGLKGLLWATAGNDYDNDDWTRMYDVLPADTDLSEVALQFDVYCPDAWSNGVIEFSFQNNLSTYGYGSTETTNTTNITYPTAVVWAPWLQDDGSIEPYSNEGWQTITIPMENVGKYQGGGYTMADVIADRAGGSYRNFIFLLVNTDIAWSDDVTIEMSNFDQLIYLDNLRLVPNKSFTVSDYDDED